MSSGEYEESEVSTHLPKAKRTRRSNKISLDAGQRGIARAMAKIVNSMVNKELQRYCMNLLEMEDLAETEARILYILQQIDKENEEEEAKKIINKRKMKSPSTNVNDLHD